MDILDLIASRQSDRQFNTSKIVEDDKLETILKAANLAPSACNAQPWKIIVVNEPSLAKEVGKAAAGLGMNKFAQDAPVHLLIIEESANFTSIIGSKLKDKYFPLIDIGVLASHIILAAESLGLASCVMGWFDEDKIKELCSIPKRKRVLLDIVIGYSDKPKRKKKRKSINSMVSYNKY